MNKHKKYQIEIAEQMEICPFNDSCKKECDENSYKQCNTYSLLKIRGESDEKVEEYDKIFGNIMNRLKESEGIGSEL